MSDLGAKSLTGDAAIGRIRYAKDRDEFHQHLCSLAPIANRHIDEINLAFTINGFPKFNVVWSLIGNKTVPAIALFCRAIKDSDHYTRWAASEALAKCDNSIATEALVAGLKDRSTLVKGVAVAAMIRLKPKSAVSQLKKIVQSTHVQTHSPGIAKDAANALAQIKGNG